MKTTGIRELARREPRQVRLSTLFLSIALVAVVSFVIGTRSDQLYRTLSPTLGLRANSDQIDFATAREVYSLLQQNYDGDIPTDKLQDGAARGVAGALGDRHTAFFDAEEAAQFQNSLDGKVSGIGAEIGTRDGQPTILRVIDNSPAQKAGVQARDQIIQVNDTPMIDATPDTAAQQIRGQAGTTVKLVVVRGQDKHEFSIERASVTDPSVASRLDRGVGIITIRRFDDTTSDLARRAAEKLLADGATKFIIDLRDNGGGELQQTGTVAGLWLANNQTVSTVRRGEKIEETVVATGTPILAGKPTLVLINGNTASASEIVAGALSDHGVATTLGEKTYGKGSVQQLFPMSGGRELKVTIARWYTPNGQNIDGAGIEPSQEVKLTRDDAEADRDPQLDAAFAQLGTS